MRLFEGSLDESVGVLARYAARGTEVYALWDDVSNRFLVERALPSTEACRTRVQYAFGSLSRRWTVSGRESARRFAQVRFAMGFGRAKASR